MDPLLTAYFNNGNSGFIFSVLDLLFDEQEKLSHPNLIKMLEMLNLKFSTSLVLTAQDTEFKKTSSNLMKAKLNYLSNKLLYTIIKDIHADFIIERYGNDLFHKKLKDILLHAEAKQSLHCVNVSTNSRCKSTLLGISVEQLPRPQWTDHNRRELEQLILKSFRKDVFDLATFFFGLSKIFFPAKDSVDLNLNTLKPIDVGVILNQETRNMVENLHVKKVNFQQTRVKMQCSLQRAGRELDNSVNKTVCLGHLQLKEDDMLKLDLAQTRSQLLLKKLRLFQLELLQQIYTPEIIDFHGNLFLKLDECIQDVRYQIMKAQRQLNVYQSLGPQFENLIEKHSNLLEQIETTKQMIDRWQTMDSTQEQPW